MTNLDDALAAAERIDKFAPWDADLKTVLAAFRKLAEAERIQMETGWGVVRSNGAWFVKANVGVQGQDTPSKAILAAYKWQQENAENVVQSK